MARVYRDPRRRTAVGQPAWCIDYVDAQGVRRRERTEASTKELVQKILRKKLDEIELIKIRGLSAVERVSFNNFLPEYLGHVNAVRTKTAQIRVPSLTKVLARTFGSKVISRIRTGDVQRWVDMRSKEMARGSGTRSSRRRWWASSSAYPQSSARRGSAATSTRTPAAASPFPG